VKQDLEQYLHPVEQGIDRLDRLGYAADVVADAGEMLDAMRRIIQIQRRVILVWGAVKQLDDGKVDEDYVKAALARYREQPA
jgi:tetrahydromethanopterin S-methyltransferase subunit G